MPFTHHHKEKIDIKWHKMEGGYHVRRRQSELSDICCTLLFNNRQESKKSSLAGLRAQMSKARTDRGDEDRFIAGFFVCEVNLGKNT